MYCNIHHLFTRQECNIIIEANMQNHLCSRINTLILSVSAYLASLLGIVMMYIWYAPKPTCQLNIFFITLTLLLLHIMTLVSVHSKVNQYLDTCNTLLRVCSFHYCSYASVISLKQVKGGLLAPGLMGMYIVFLCWSALRR